MGILARAWGAITCDPGYERRVQQMRANKFLKAVEAGDIDKVEFLLDLGFDPNYEYEGYRPSYSEGDDNVACNEYYTFSAYRYARTDEMKSLLRRYGAKTD